MSQIDQRLIERYGTLSLLGAGGMGVVYRVFDPVRGCEVALKVVQVYDPALLERLRREARVLASLSHPNVCPILEWCELSDAAWIVMPVLDGRTLDRCAAELTVDTLVEVLIQVCRGVEAAHELGLVHRDLKPANIMLLTEADASLRAVVMDFGIARSDSERTLTGTHEVLGTPAYMAPEQARGETASADGRADVWGLGATLYDALAGQPPFGRGSLAQILARVLDDDVLSPRVHRPSIPDALARICLKALERDPQRRYASVAELRADLERFRQGSAVDAPNPGPGFYLRRMLVRHPRFWGSSALLVLALLATLGYALWTSQASTERAAAARELAGLAERVRAGMRAARLAPLHDIDQERRPLLADIAALRQRYDGAERSVRVDLDRALAQAYFELGLLQDARRHARQLLDSGAAEDADRVLYARSELTLQAQSVAAMAALPDGQRELALSALRAEHLAPALVAIQALALPPPPPLLRAELALIDAHWEVADAALAQYIPSGAADTNAMVLAGDIARARASSSFEHGDLAPADDFQRQAREHYQSALAIVRSDPDVLRRMCQLGAGRLALSSTRGQERQSPPQTLDPACSDLLIADAQAQTTHEALAAAWLAIAGAHDQSNQPQLARRLLAQSIAASERAVASAPGRPEARLLLARALILDAGLTATDFAAALVDLDRAVTELENASARAPGSLPVLIALGEALRDRGRVYSNQGKLAPGGPALTDFDAARTVLQRAVALQPDALPPRRSLSLTRMFTFYALRDDHPEQAMLLVQAAIADMDAALLTHPDHPDLLFDQGANLGDQWNFMTQSGADAELNSSLPVLDRALALFAHVREVAPARPDGYDYELGYRAQAGETLRTAGLDRKRYLDPVPKLIAAARANAVQLSAQFVGWALTEQALAQAETDETAAVAAFDAALVELEAGLADSHRHADSVRMFLLWSSARARLLGPSDPQGQRILARAEVEFGTEATSERGRIDNILWCAAGELAYERRHAQGAQALADAEQRLSRCAKLGPRYFRSWQPLLDRVRAARMRPSADRATTQT